MRQPSWLLLDADGVTQHATFDFGGHLAQVSGLEAAAARAFVADVFTAEREALTGRAELPPLLAEVAARHAVRAPLDALLAPWFAFGIDEDVVALARRARAAGVRCALASNQNALRARAMRERKEYTDAFDAWCLSCDVGERKPDDAYFRAVLERLAVPAHAVLFVDDAAANVAAARSAGMAALHFDASAAPGSPERWDAARLARELARLGVLTA